MSLEEKRRLRLAICLLRQAQDELEILGFHGVSDHIRFCANDIALKEARLNAAGADVRIDYQNGKFVCVGASNGS